jgi:hypothetical protein
MRNKRRLPEDPRWLPFCKRYAPDCKRFAIEVQGLVISDQQDDLLTEISYSRARLSVSSGHGTGKTTSIANIMLWHLLCYIQSNGILTANDMDQIKETVWKEVEIAVERISDGPHGWIVQYIEVLADGFMRIKGFEKSWFFTSKTANEKTANKVAGRHGKWFLAIADEAATIPDLVLKTILGALTEEHNRMLLTSQGVRNAGFFWSTQNEWSTEQNGDWTALSFSSIDSPFVSNEALKEYRDIYDDDEYRVRVLGLFPQDSSNHMMSLKVAESMYKRGKIINDDEPYGYLVLSDVAGGEGVRDKSAIVIAKVIGYGDFGVDARRVEIIRIPLLNNKVKVNVLANPINETADELDNPTIVVDNGGMGLSVNQDLEAIGKAPIRVNWHVPCFQKKNKERYLNLRAQASHQAARAAKEGRLSILCPEHKKTMVSQSSRIPKAYTSNYRIQVPPKGSKEWEGLGSPDLWDAVCFAFLENVHYTVAENDTDIENRLYSDAEKVLNAGRHLFADLA